MVTRYTLCYEFVSIKLTQSLLEYRDNELPILHTLSSCADVGRDIWLPQAETRQLVAEDTQRGKAHGLEKETTTSTRT